MLADATYGSIRLAERLPRSRRRGRSGTAARGALNQLTEDGVLTEVTLAKAQSRVAAIGLFALVGELERDLSGGAISAAATRWGRGAAAWSHASPTAPHVRRAQAAVDEDVVALT